MNIENDTQAIIVMNKICLFKFRKYNWEIKMKFSDEPSA